MGKPSASRRVTLPCLICGGVGEVHHLLTRKAWPEYRDSEFNLVPMCRKHHSEVHSYGMTKMGTKYPLFEVALKHRGWFYSEEEKKWKAPVFGALVKDKE